MDGKVNKMVILNEISKLTEALDLLDKECTAYTELAQEIDRLVNKISNLLIPEDQNTKKN